MGFIFKMSTAHLDLLGSIFTFKALHLFGHAQLYILPYEWVLINLNNTKYSVQFFHMHVANLHLLYQMHLIIKSAPSIFTFY